MESIASRRDFPVEPVSRRTWALLAALWVVLLLAGLLGGTHQQSPHNPVPWWVVVVFGTALVPAGLLAVLLHRDIRMEGDRLVVAAGLLFARKVSVRDLALEGARILDLDEHTEFKPVLRLLGVGWPGFNAGHFLLRGRKRAFCLLTRRNQVLLLPLRDGKLILLTPEKPQALLDALRGASR